MNDKLVASVCLLTYNHEKYIAKSIEGVLLQKTTIPFELIIGDDTSSDDTPEICALYEARYPNIVRYLP